MPSTYSPNKGYELQATGENQGTWGILLNNNALAVVDLNLGGRLAVTIDAANVDLTATQAQNVYITLTGTLTGNRDLTFPASNGGFYYILNNTSGAFSVTVKPLGGTGVVVPQGGLSRIFINPTATTAVHLGTPATATGGAVLPISSDGTALGTTALPFSDAFLASGGVINWAAGDVTITHSTNALAFAGASSGYTFDTSIKPSTNDGAALGASGTAWSDVFLADGGVINFNAGALTLTQSGTTLTNSGNEAIGGTLGVTGAATLSSTLGVTGAATLSSTLAVTGAATLSSTLAVTGTSTFTGSVAMNGGGTLGNDSGDTVVIKGTTVNSYMSGLLSTSSKANLQDALDVGSGDTPTFTALNLSTTDSLRMNSVNPFANSVYTQQMLNQLGTTKGNILWYNSGWTVLAPATGTPGYQLTIADSGGTLAWGPPVSDHRLKENVQEIKDAGTIIDGLRPVTFRWNCGDKLEAAGFIAHEAAELLPSSAVSGEGKDAVDDDGNMVIQGLDKTQIIAYLVSETQNIRRRLAALET